MAETRPTTIWAYRLAYVGLTGAIVFLHILPVQVGPVGYPGPDLLICITFAWVLRRPHYLPAPLIAAMFLATDLIFMRPPGLWAALVVLGTEFLRSRAATSRDLSFPAEWVTVAAVLLALTLADRVILAMFMIDQAGFGLTALQLVATLVTYPLVVVLSRLVLGLRRPVPGETDARGRPL